MILIFLFRSLVLRHRTGACSKPFASFNDGLAFILFGIYWLAYARIKAAMKPRVNLWGPAMQ